MIKLLDLCNEPFWSAPPRWLMTRRMSEQIRVSLSSPRAEHSDVSLPREN